MKGQTFFPFVVLDMLKKGAHVNEAIWIFAIMKWFLTPLSSFHKIKKEDSKIYEEQFNDIENQIDNNVKSIVDQISKNDSDEEMGLYFTNLEVENNIEKKEINNEEEENQEERESSSPRRS